MAAFYPLTVPIPISGGGGTQITPDTAVMLLVVLIAPIVVALVYLAGSKVLAKVMSKPWIAADGMTSFVVGALTFIILAFGLIVLILVRIAVGGGE